MASLTGSHDSQPARRNSGSQLLQELEALSQSLYMSQQPLAPRRTGNSLSLPNAKNLKAREERAVQDEAIPLPGLANARHNSRAPTESRNMRHSISHPQPLESNGMGVKVARYSSSAVSGITNSEKAAEIRGRRNQYSLSPFRRRKGEELNHADDDRNRNVLWAHQEEEDVDFSKKMEHKKSAFWTWKPVRALSHIGMHRFNCIFSVYVNAIHGLSPSVNGLRLAVSLRRKESRDGAVQTMPARVFQSVAEFDENLRIHCHVYGSNNRHGSSHGIMKFQSRPFAIFVVAVDAEELDFGKHQVDLGTLLQEAVLKHPAGEDSDDGWNVTFPLSGKARGAELVVGLGYEILDKDERYHIGSCRFRDYSDHHEGGYVWGNSKSLPNSIRGTPKSVAADPGFSGAIYNSGSPFHSQIDRDNPVDFIRMAHLSLDDPDLTPESVVLHSQMLQNENLALIVRSEGANLGFREVDEQKNSTSDAVNHPSDQEIENADDEEYFEVEEQGVELVEGESVEDETTTTAEQLEKEGSVSGGHEVVKEVIQEASQRRLNELDSIVQQISVLVDKAASQESAIMEPQGNQDSEDYEIHNDAVKGTVQNRDEVLMDDEVGAVEGEFLHLLESEEIDLDSEENMANSGLKDGSTADSEDDMDQVTSILAELAETELKQMSHDSESKARAKLLEFEENEALMQKMGLNENAFKNSPRNPDAIAGNFFDKSTKKQIKDTPPDLGDGLGSHVVQVQTRDGGMLASMNPAHFRSGGGRLVMHVSKPVVLPGEMGDTAVEILQKMAGLGTTNMTSQAIDCMPLDNITGKTVEQIAFEGMASAITKNGYSEQNANLKDQAGKGSLLSKVFGTILAGSQKSKAAGLQSRGTMLGECASVDYLVSVAMQKIEAMALEGLKIQAEMSEEEAPYSVPPVPLAKQTKIHGHNVVTDSNSLNSNRLMAMAISLEEWIGLDSGLYDEVATNENTRAILAAHHALKHQDLQAFADKQKKKEGEGYMGNSLTVALLVQLRDPLRNYEAVGCPMIGLVEAERVVVPRGFNKELAEGYWDPPRFKIKGVHMSGLKIDEKKKVQRAIWGSQQHQYQKSTASRWLTANGMAGNNRHTNYLLKSKAQQHPTKAGEFVWSISARLNSSSTGAATAHLRNPDIVIPNQALLRRV